MGFGQKGLEIRIDAVQIGDGLLNGVMKFVTTLFSRGRGLASDQGHGSRAPKDGGKKCLLHKCLQKRER